MNEQTFRDFVEKGESDTVEFKTSFDKEAIETLAAFANTKGGTIVIGVQNSGKLGGVQLGKETLQNWTNQIKLNTAPSIAPDVSVITVNNRGQSESLNDFWGRFAPIIVLEPEVKSWRSLAVGTLRFSMVSGICQGCETKWSTRRAWP